MKKVLIGTPALRGEVSTGYLQGCLEVQRHAIENKSYHIDFMFLEQVSLISKARDMMLADWYYRYKDYDYLVFIDADQGFRGTAIYDLISSPYDVTVAPVPMKQIDFTALHAFALINESLGLQDLAACVDYNFIPSADVPFDKQDRHIPVLYAGTGFMCIPRRTIDRVFKALGDTPSTTHAFYHSIVVDGKKQNVPALFIPTASVGHLWGEDYSFCARLHQQNMQVYVDTLICVTHSGSITYEGNLTKKVNFYNSLENIS